MTIAIKRIYDPPADGDGFRVLVDRLWPRGVSKTKAHIDLWMKDVAPSDELRKWSHHDPAKWAEFRKRYALELDSNPEPVRELVTRARRGRVTLLFAAKDSDRNNAVALKDYLEAL